MNETVDKLGQQLKLIRSSSLAMGLVNEALAAISTGLVAAKDSSDPAPLIDSHRRARELLAQAVKQLGGEPPCS